MELVSGLSKHFRTYLDQELKGYRKVIQESRAEHAIRAGAATIKSAVSAIPAISEVVSILDVLGTGAEAVRAGGDAFAFLDHNASDQAARKERDDRVDAALKAISPKNEAKVLTALRQMRTIAAEIQRPF